MTIPSQMRGVVLNGHGGLDMLEYREDLAVPSPGPGEVLVEVAACGMNNTDINTRTGWYSKSVSGATGAAVSDADEDGSWGGGLTFPRIQGADPAGRIVAVGPGVAETRIGERVIVDPWLRDPGGDLEKARYLGSEADGGYAEYVAVPSVNAVAVTTDLSDVELASFACSYSTAEHMLHRAGVAAGQWVLVTGASGGVGSGLVQLAKRRDARVVAIAGESKREAVVDVGADVVIARESADVPSAIRNAVGRVDVFADVVGGVMFAPLFELLKRGGHYVTSGAIAGPIVDLDLRTLYLNDLTMHGATVLSPEVFANLVGYIERGEIRPIIGAAYPLEEMAAAQTAFMEKRFVGAIVMEVTS